MAEKIKVDESLTDQFLNDFINECLLSIYELKYTDFSYKYDKFDFYFKIKDLLRPSMYLMGNSYSFNTHTILRLNTNSVHHFALQGKEAFFAYLKVELGKSICYTNYINRLPKGPPNVSIQKA